MGSLCCAHLCWVHRGSHQRNPPQTGASSHVAGLEAAVLLGRPSRVEPPLPGGLPGSGHRSTGSPTGANHVPDGVDDGNGHVVAAEKFLQLFRSEYIRGKMVEEIGRVAALGTEFTYACR